MDRNDAIDWYEIAKAAQRSIDRMTGEISILANELSWDPKTRELSARIANIIRDRSKEK